MNKELLESAAKACGYITVPNWNEIKIIDDSAGFLITKDWNPMLNIADCAEIEAQLEIDVSWFKDSVECCTYRFLAKEHYSVHPTKQSARMLASTRVAAEIGKRMSE